MKGEGGGIYGATILRHLQPIDIPVGRQLINADRRRNRNFGGHYREESLRVINEAGSA